MKYRVILEPDEDGMIIASVPALPGCISQGETKEQAIKNIKEAIELYLEADVNELVEYEGEHIKVTI